VGEFSEKKLEKRMSRSRAAADGRVWMEGGVMKRESSAIGRKRNGRSEGNPVARRLEGLVADAVGAKLLLLARRHCSRVASSTTSSRVMAMGVGRRSELEAANALKSEQRSGENRPAEPGGPPF
jgi:hypothetical protein